MGMMLKLGGPAPVNHQLANLAEEPVPFLQ